MSGGSAGHSTLQINLAVAGRNALRGGRCRAFSADLQVRVSSLTYTYPELSLVCGKPILADERQDVLLNPTVIFEVLSPSTAVYDRGIKLQHLGISRLSGPPARICGSNDRSFACIEFQPA